MTSHTNYEMADEKTGTPMETDSAPSGQSALTMREGALALAKLGFHVFPCIPRSKFPLGGSHGHLDATDDVDVVERLWSENPEANIGIACSASNLVVIDIDARSGGYDTFVKLEEEWGQLPQTAEVRTGAKMAGMHFYYRAPKGVRFKGKLGPGIDIKHEGYVMGPSSEHPDGGRYAWVTSPSEADVAELPLTWLERTVKPTKEKAHQRPKVDRPGNPSTTPYGHAAVEREIKNMETASEGERNDTLNKAAFALGQLHAGDEVADVRGELVQAAMDAGLPDQEARSTVASGWQAGLLEPRSAPEGPGNEADRESSPEWDEPVSLDVGFLAPFPIEALPPILREQAVAVATAVQVPVDMPGVLSLGAVSAACGSRLCVEVAHGYQEPTNLYVVVAMHSGERKTAAKERMTSPIEKYERDLCEEQRVAVAQECAEYDALVKRLEEAKRQTAKAPIDERAIAIETVREAAAELELRRPPVLPRLLVDDATPEKVTSLLAAHNAISVISSEGGIFDIIGGRYSNEPNLDVFLKAHTGESLRVDRMNRPTEHVGRPILTMVLAVQPDVLRRMAERPGFRTRGLVARFLYSLPASMLGRRAIDPPPVEPAISHGYEQLLRRLLSNAGSTTEPQIIQLSPQAKAEWVEFCEKHEPRLAESGDLAGMTDWAGKLTGAIIRIAGLLHAAQSPSTPAAEPISASTMKSAIALGEYFTRHAIAAFALMGADAALDGARRVLNWLERTRVESFNIRNAFEALKGRFPRVDELRAALAILEERLYIRRRPDNRRVGPGRQPSPTYDVNPLWSQTAKRRSQNSQNSQAS